MLRRDIEDVWCGRHGELCCQDFKASDGVRRELDEPAKWSLLEGGGKYLTPCCLVGFVKDHLCFKDV